MPAAFGRHTVLWEGITGAAGAPPPAPAPPALRQQRVGVSGVRAFGYEGFSSSGPAPTTPTITVQLLDAAVNGNPLPGLTSIRWAFWDTAAEVPDTWVTPPTGSGSAETTDSNGQLILPLIGSSKTSGQQLIVELHLQGANPRTFKAKLTVD